MQSALSSCAPALRVKEAEKKAAAARRDARAVASALETLGKRIVDYEREVSAKIAACAGAEEMKNKAEGRDLDGLEKRLLAEISSLAPLSELENMRARVTCLEDENEITENKVEAALRFIDWYAERGESYEHNFQAVE